MVPMKLVLQTNEIDLAVGAKLCVHRLKRKVSQATLAELLGVAVETVQEFETGVLRLGAPAMITAALVLGIVPSDLLP